jgi:hypothetical protein
MGRVEHEIHRSLGECRAREDDHQRSSPGQSRGQRALRKRSGPLSAAIPSVHAGDLHEIIREGRGAPQTAIRI